MHFLSDPYEDVRGLADVLLDMNVSCDKDEFTGAISDFSIYNYQFSESELVERMAPVAPDPIALDSFFALDDNSEERGKTKQSFEGMKFEDIRSLPSLN